MVDLAVVVTTYSGSLMPLTVPRSLAAAAAMIVALGGLLPAPHLHAGHAGALVHVHQATGPVAPHAQHVDDHDHAVVTHGDHADARAFVQSYSVTTRFDLKAATVATVMPLLAAIQVRSGQPNRRELLPTHDPPFRFTSAPAPPALA